MFGCVIFLLWLRGSGVCFVFEDVWLMSLCFVMFVWLLFVLVECGEGGGLEDWVFFEKL